MNNCIPIEGKLKEGDIFSILAYIHRNSISGLLVVDQGKCQKKLVIEDHKVVFSMSNLKEESFGNHLLKNSVINQSIYDQTNLYMIENKKRFGRALIELGYLNYEQIWWWIQDHLKAIIYSFFEFESGSYRIRIDTDRDIENIVLDIDVLSLIVDGIRNFKTNSFIEKKFTAINNIYLVQPKLLETIDLKPYELHIIDLVERETKFADIIKKSELLEIDTKRLLYLFLVIGVVSSQKLTPTSEESPDQKDFVKTSCFSSFDEALKHYNLKFELVYKTLSKEIGPITLSILQKAIDDMLENLPSYMQKIQINPDGKLNENVLLKSVWYHDFDETIGEFLRGLEEILYTEIYAVRKHLGVKYEKQVLKWITKTGS